MGCLVQPPWSDLPDFEAKRCRMSRCRNANLDPAVTNMSKPGHKQLPQSSQTAAWSLWSLRHWQILLQLWVVAQQATNTKEANGNADALPRKRRKLLGPVTQVMPRISTSRTKTLRPELAPEIGSAWMSMVSVRLKPRVFVKAWRPRLPCPEPFFFASCRPVAFKFGRPLHGHHAKDR